MTMHSQRPPIVPMLHVVRRRQQLANLSVVALHGQRLDLPEEGGVGLIRTGPDLGQPGEVGDEAG